MPKKIQRPAVFPHLVFAIRYRRVAGCNPFRPKDFGRGGGIRARIPPGTGSVASSRSGGQGGRLRAGDASPGRRGRGRSRQVEGFQGAASLRHCSDSGRQIGRAHV